MESQELHVSNEQRLKANEKNHKGGVYDGKSSGAIYEQERLKAYKESHKDKKIESTDEFYRKKMKYRTWIEILSQPVPYDAMYAIDKRRMPALNGLNSLDRDGNYANICPKNHHVATLGHDPVLGWIFGTANIMSKTISMMNFQSYGVVSVHTIRSLNEFHPVNELEFYDQKIDYDAPWLMGEIIKYCVDSIREDSKRLPAAVVRQGIHVASDKYCKEGLPIPLVSTLDPKKAQKMINEGWNSREFTYLLGKDLANVGINAAVSIFINLVIKSIYLFCMEPDEEDFDLREVRIQKILTISNIIASSSNILYVTIKKNIAKLDIGGIGVAMLQLFQSKKFISQMKQEYIAKGLEKRIMGTDNWMEIAMQEVYENER
jgi:hypothetical protein